MIQSKKLFRMSLGISFLIIISLSAPVGFEFSLPPPITVTSPNNQYRGFFGLSVASTSDLVAIGSAESVHGKPLGGVVYLYTPIGYELRSITNPTPQEDAYFGGAVAVLGSLLLVGAPGEVIDGKQSVGSAYLFNSTTGTLIHSLFMPGPRRDSLFGESVALTSNGYALVGAGIRDKENYTAPGRVYVYSTTTGELVKTLGVPLQTASEFGWSIAVGGDLVLIGARGESINGCSICGAAYLYNATDWKRIQTFTTPNPVAGGNFGTAVALSEGYAVIGADYENINHTIYGAGHAYIFNATSGILLYTLTSPRHQQYGTFGYSVAISGNWAIVSAPGEFSHNYYQAGNVYVYSLRNGSLMFELSSPNKQVDGEFGYGIAGSSTSVAISAPYESALDEFASGHVYIYNSF